MSHSDSENDSTHEVASRHSISADHAEVVVKEDVILEIKKTGEDKENGGDNKKAKKAKKAKKEKKDKKRTRTASNAANLELEEIDEEVNLQPQEPKEDESKDDKDKKKEPPKKVKFFQLLRYADGLDIAMMIAGSISAILFGAVMPAFSLIFGELIDAFNGNNVYDEIKKFALYFVYAGIVALVAAYMQSAFWLCAAERQIKRLREDYLTAIMRQDIGWFDTVGTGELTSRISSDPILVQEAIGEKVGTMIQFMSTFVLGFTLGFVRGWKLTLVLASVTPLVAASGAFMMKVMQSLSTKGQAAYAKAGIVATEVISSIRTVASFTGEPRELERYSVNLDDARKIGIKKALLTGLGLGLTFFIFYGCYALALWYGGQLTIKGEYTGGKVLTVFFTVIMGAFALGQASPSAEAISKGQGAAYTIYETIARQPPIDSSSSEGKQLEKVKGKISLKKVEHCYPTRPDVKVFKGIDLTIKRGQKVALVGQSGSGKSSVISLIQRFYDPLAGQVLLDGNDIKTLNITWLRSQIGLVGQEPVLFQGTIADNIRYGKANATMEEVEEAAKSANAHKFISKFPEGYNTQVGEKGTQLSGGQKQRIAIARAIIKDPKILLLDEATSALDSESEKVVQNALDKVMQGRTTVIVAHRLSTIRDADVIAVINDGVVVEKGTHDELMALNGHYAELVRIQQGGEGQGSRSDPKSPLMKSIDVAKKEGAAKEDPSKEVKSAAGEKQEELYPVGMGRLLMLNRPEWPFLLIGCVAAAVNGSINPIFSIIFSHMVELYYKSDDEIRDQSRWWALGFLGMGVAAFIVNIFQAFFFGLSGEGLTHRIRRVCFNSILRQDVGWFDSPKHSTGMITSRLASDATLVESLVGTRVGLTVQNLSTITAGLVIAFFYNWKLTLVVLATSPLMVFANIIYMVAMKGFSTRTQQAVAEANQVVTEAISNIRTVASFTQERKVLKTYADKLVKPNAIGIRTSHIAGLLMGSSQAIMFLSYALSFWYGGKLISDGEASFLDVMTVFMSIFLSAMAIGQASSMAPNAAKAKTAASVIFEMVDHKSAVDSLSTEGDKLKKVKGTLEFANVHFHYPTRPDAPVFKGLNLKVEAGQVVALVGQSGSGKSSVVSLLERFYLPLEGEILLDGTNINTLNIRWLRDQISLVGQEPVLFIGTIAENIRYAKPDATMEEVEAAAKAANAHRFITKFPDGYNTQVGEKGAQLSGGQKQRIAIARAIIKDPKILLLDEATSALDTESEKVVQQALDKVMKGRTTIVVAHRLSTIKNADIIAVINDGQVAEQGTHDELMKKQGHYFKLVQRQT